MSPSNEDVLELVDLYRSLSGTMQRLRAGAYRAYSHIPLDFKDKRLMAATLDQVQADLRLVVATYRLDAVKEARQSLPVGSPDSPILHKLQQARAAVVKERQTALDEATAIRAKRVEIKSGLTSYGVHQPDDIRVDALLQERRYSFEVQRRNTVETIERLEAEIAELDEAIDWPEIARGADSRSDRKAAKRLEPKRWATELELAARQRQLENISDVLTAIDIDLDTNRAAREARHDFKVDPKMSAARQQRKAMLAQIDAVESRIGQQFIDALPEDLTAPELALRTALIGTLDSDRVQQAVGAWYANEHRAEVAAVSPELVQYEQSQRVVDLIVRADLTDYFTDGLAVDETFVSARSFEERVNADVIRLDEPVWNDIIDGNESGAPSITVAPPLSLDSFSIA